MRPMRRRVFVQGQFQAFHTDPHLGEGRHLHLWTARLYYAAEPFRDGRAIKAALDAFLGAFDGRDLPQELWATEDLAAFILSRFGNGYAERIVLERADGPSADVEWA